MNKIKDLQDKDNSHSKIGLKYLIYFIVNDYKDIDMDIDWDTDINSRLPGSPVLDKRESYKKVRQKY